MTPPPDLGPDLRIERPLARTPFGEAWVACAAERETDDARVTVVLLAPQWLALVADRARLADALRQHLGLAHATSDALLPLLDVVDAPDGGLALLLPLEERAPASARLARGRAFATSDVADAARALGSALQEAHAAGLRHGALSPALLYLGDGRPARALGLGWSDAFVEAGAERAAVLATLDARGFVAPEVAEAQAPQVTTDADIYGLGATLFACMTGRPPFGGRTTSLVMASVLADEGLSGEMPKVVAGDAAAVEHAAATERLTQALLRAVERAPADRWPTAADFVRALDPRVATPPPVLAQPAPLVKPRGCLTSVAIVVLLAGFAAATLAMR